MGTPLSQRDDSKDPGLEIKESPIHGLGLFATRPFKKGDTICRALRKVRSTGIADFDLLQTRWGRKINHQDEPNARPVLDARTSDVLVVALEKIGEGDEITVNYEEFGNAVGAVAEDLPPETRIETSPGKLETALRRRRRPLADIVSLAPPSGRPADDPDLVDVKEFDLETEDGRTIRLHRRAAEALAKAQEDLPEGFRICVFNGFRSQKDQERAHKKTERMLKKTHPAGWRKLVKKYMGSIADSNPMSHRSGLAADVRIFAPDGKELDLGGMKMDERDRTDHYEKGPLSRREAAVKENRRMLKEVLEKHGFKNNPDEWWHWGYRPPMSVREAASMKHPGPTHRPEWNIPHISTLPFMPVRKEKPPGFNEEFDFEKHDDYRWMEGGTFQSPARLPMPAPLAQYLDRLAGKLGWRLDIEPVGDGEKVTVGREAASVKGNRRLRLGRLIPKIAKKIRSEDVKKILAWVQHKNETVPAGTGWMLIVSAEPSDLRTISTGRGWTSCVDLDKHSGNPERAKEIESSIDARDLVAYAVDKAGRWLARIVLRFDGVGGWWPEELVYGQPSAIDFEHFRQVVNDWIDKNGIRGEEGRVSPIFKGWSDKLKSRRLHAPTPEELLQEEEEIEQLRGPEPPEEYKGTGRSLMPPLSSQGVRYLVYFKLERDPDIDRDVIEDFMIDASEREGRMLQDESPEDFRFVEVKTRMPGYPAVIDALSYKGILMLKNDPAIQGLMRMASSISPRTWPPLSGRDPVVRTAGRRPGVKEEYIWLWDDGVRKGVGRVSAPRLASRRNVEEGTEVKGIEHRTLADELRMSGDDAQRALRGFVTYNDDGTIEVTTYGAPFSSFLESNEKAYNAVEKAFGLLPGGYTQTVLPFQRGSLDELMKLPTGTTGDADDASYAEDAKMTSSSSDGKTGRLVKIMLASDSARTAQDIERAPMARTRPKPHPLCREFTSPDFLNSMTALAVLADHIAPLYAKTKTGSDSIVQSKKFLDLAADKLPLEVCGAKGGINLAPIHQNMRAVLAHADFLIPLAESAGVSKGYLRMAKDARTRLDGILSRLSGEPGVAADDSGFTLSQRDADDPERGLLGEPTPALKDIPTERGFEEEPLPSFGQPGPIGPVPTVEDVLETVKSQGPLDPEELKGMERHELEFLRARLGIALNVVERAMGAEPTFLLSPREQEEREEKEVLRGTIGRRAALPLSKRAVQPNEEPARVEHAG